MAAPDSVLRPPPQPLRVPTPLARVHRVLARPVAALFLLLGVAPGQLSLQSLTLTILGLLRMAAGGWAEAVQGAALVYLGLLFDRADLLLMERRGRPAAFIAFLGQAIDRLVEAFLVAWLGALAARGVAGSPWPAWQPLDAFWLVAATATATGLLLANRALEAASDAFLLRHHLLGTRRLPGTAILERRRPARSVLAPLAGRDEAVLLACLGAALAQPQAALLLLGFLQAAAFLESLVLFHFRLKDAEAEASRVLGPDYP